MFSTPFTSCSIGEATVSASTCGLAPGYLALTTTVGGTISGNCAIGSWKMASPPTMTMTIDRTAAKIGRSIKKWENFIGASGPRLLLRGGGGVGGLGPALASGRFHLGARPNRHQAVNHHPIIGLNSLA